MKRVRANWSYRLRAGLKPAGQTLGWLATAAATVTGILAASGVILPFAALYWIGGGCLAGSSVVLAVKSRSQHLPDIIIDDESTDGRYQAAFCDAASLREANRLTKPYFRHEYVPDRVAESWRQKNPKGFVVIRNQQGELSASFGVLALEPSFMNQFIKGRVRDNDLEPADILDANESKRSRTLYISGVVVRDPDSTIGHRRAYVMVWAMLNYIKKLYGVKKRRTVYALAVSKTSRNLLQRSGFSVATGATARTDQLDLYALELNDSALKTIAERVGDHSPSCSVAFEHRT